MPRPPLVVGLDAAPRAGMTRAARLRALARSCELTVVTASGTPVAFAAALAHAAERSNAAAAVLLDGPAVRATVRLGRFDRVTRAALWTDAADRAVPDFYTPLPGHQRGRAPWPDEIWWEGPRLDTDRLEFMPGAFRSLPAGEAPRRAGAWARSAPVDPAPARGLTTIVIPCWNGLADTKRCVSAVLRNTRVPFEVVAVDNGSTDGTARWLRSLRDRRVRVLVNETNEGFARAMNRGLAEARGPYAVWLNNDCFVTPGWLERMQHAMERAPWIGAVGPMTDGANGLQSSNVPSPDPRELDRFAVAWSLKNEGRMAWAHRLIGFCVLHRTELLRRAGYLDERFGLGCYEDFDWCLRARQAGYELFVAEDVYVSHRGHAAFDGNGLDHMEIVRVNREAFIEKWCRKGLQFLDELDGPLGGSTGGFARKAPGRRARARRR